MEAEAATAAPTKTCMLRSATKLKTQIKRRSLVIKPRDERLIATTVGEELAAYDYDTTTHTPVRCMKVGLGVFNYVLSPICTLHLYKDRFLFVC